MLCEMLDAVYTIPFAVNGNQGVTPVPIWLKLVVAFST